MTWKLYDIILQYKEMFFERYIRYDLYCKDILYNFSAQRKICLKHIQDITYTLKIYDIVIQYKEFFFFEKYTTYSLYFKEYDIIVQHKEKFVWNIYQIQLLLWIYITYLQCI